MIVYKRWFCWDTTIEKVMREGETIMFNYRDEKSKIKERIFKMLQQGKRVEQIAEELGEEVEVIRKLCREMMEYA